MFCALIGNKQRDAYRQGLVQVHAATLVSVLARWILSDKANSAMNTLAIGIRQCALKH